MINSATFGNNDQTSLALVYGHRVWDVTYNDCGFGDQSNIESTWALTTARSSAHPDGISTVDKGEVYDLGCGDFPDDPRVIATTVSGASSRTRIAQGRRIGTRSRNAPRARGASMSPASGSIGRA